VFQTVRVILTGIRNALTGKYKTWERNTDTKISRIQKEENKSDKYIAVMEGGKRQK
jgi:hypothetical protein